MKKIKFEYNFTVELNEIVTSEEANKIRLEINQTMADTIHSIKLQDAVTRGSAIINNIGGSSYVTDELGKPITGTDYGANAGLPR